MKKILIISQNSFSQHANNGKTLSNIFSNYNADDIYQVYFQDEIPETSKFKNFIRVRDIDLIKRIFSLDYKPIRKIEPLDTVDNHHIDKPTLLVNFINIAKNFGWIRDIVREYVYANQSLYFEELKEELKQFKPDLILLVPSNYRFTYNIALSLSMDLEIPLYLYLLDDRYFMQHNNILSTNIVFRQYRPTFEKVVKHSTYCFSIGHLMAEKYSNHFKKPFGVLSNPVEYITTLENNTYSNLLTKKKVKVLYAGGLTLGRFQALLQFSHILNISATSLDIDIELIVCSGDSLSNHKINKMKNKNINFMGKLSSSELNELYKDVDFVSHIESHRKRHMKSTFYSISTKIPECLINEVCIIAFGPPEIASMKLIHENDIGCYIDSKLSVSYASRTVSELIKNPSKALQLAQNGKDFAIQNFSHSANSKNFFAIINN